MFLYEMGSTDIDEWTFEELQKSISEFKQVYRPGDTIESVENWRRLAEEKE